MAAPETVVNLAEKCDAFEDHWSPKIIGQVNDLHLTAVKVQGEFVWRQHDDTDGFFLVMFCTSRGRRRGAAAGR